MSWGRTLSLIGASATLVGCVLFIRGIRDLTLAGIKQVEVRELNLHAKRISMGPGAPPTHKLVRIEVETSVDIHRIATESELNIWMEVWNCRTGASLFGYDGILYYKDVRVNYMNTSSLIQGLYAKASRGRKQGEPFLYDFYIEPESDLDQPRGPGQPDLRRPYNLEEAPFAICFHLGGGNMMGGYFVSNTVVVPADDIAKAIDRPGV